MIVVFVTFESKEDAETVANYLIDNHIAACVSIVPVKSFYIWKGEKMSTQEYEGIIKTTEEQFENIKQVFAKLLPYEIPQIIAVPVVKVNDSYEKWLKEAVRKSR